MKPEILPPRRRIPWRRIIVALAIAWASWSASRLLEGLERSDRAGEAQRGPACTSTVYYDDHGDPCWPNGRWCPS